MAGPTAPVLGFNGKLYYNANTYISPTWTEISNVGDITVTDERDVQDLPVRSMGSFMTHAVGLRKLTYAWQMVYDPADAAQTALKTAYGTGATVEFLILDGDEATTGSSGVRVTCQLSKFARQEPIGGAMMVDVEIKPAYGANAPAAYTV